MSETPAGALEATAEEPTDLSALVPDPENRRTHNERNIGMVASALREVGAARSIVIDETNVILAGNGVVLGAEEAGIRKVRVIDAEGDELIAVRRRGLTPAQKRALAIYDNRAAELAEWNPEQIQADQAAGLALEPWFSAPELAKILGVPPAEVKSLAERFGVPPFSVLDARQGYWQERKRAWLALGIQSELGRGGVVWVESESGSPIDRQQAMKEKAVGRVFSNATLPTRHAAITAQDRKARKLAPGGSPRPATKLGADGRTRRGDGKGRTMLRKAGDDPA